MERKILCADSHLHAYAPFGESMRGLGTLARLGVRDAALLAYTYIETGIDNNLICLRLKEACGDVRVRVQGGLYYDRELNGKTMPYLEQAKLLLAMGCDGIKFLDMKPNYQLYCGTKMDEEVYDALYDFLEAEQVPATIHVADPAEFWTEENMTPTRRQLGWYYADPKFMTFRQIYDSLLRRLEKNPGLKCCIAHFGFLSEDPALCRRILEKYPGVSFDLAPAAEIFRDFAKNVTVWKEFFEEFSTRILYGTDTAPNGPDERIEALHDTMLAMAERREEELFPIPCSPKDSMRGFALSETAKANVLRENYFRFYSADVKPVDRGLLTEHAKRIRGIALKNGDTEILRNLEDFGF